ncbi:S53 family peptidase [Ktedonobacter robiniae]|nr:S53 family peptidase [Ktedonobacter robiniae]
MRRYILFLFLVFLLAACTTAGFSKSMDGGTATASSQPSAVPGFVDQVITTCPAELANYQGCHTPYTLRQAYDIESLTKQGFTGKGQTVVVIVSFGSPTLQKDLDAFSRQFGLPQSRVQILSPLGTVPFNTQDSDMVGWATETTLDVQLIHAMAPEANIVVMTSPVSETQGVQGLPEFKQLEEYAVNHHLGQIFSQSWAASEATLADQAGQQLIKSYADFYKQTTLQDHWTIFVGTGDQGATDFADLNSTKLVNARNVTFPADVPWVTAVGGTTLASSQGATIEHAWSGSGGGFSKFFAQPDYQKALPSSVQAQSGGQRGLPDVSANADPSTGMSFYYNGNWSLTGGTSASTPTWAGLMAIANQLAGHPLGFINPTLYSLAQGAGEQQNFHDVTIGYNNNQSTKGGETVNVKGFQAVPGWDAVTGLGTPKGSSLLRNLAAATK